VDLNDVSMLIEVESTDGTETRITLKGGSSFNVRERLGSIIAIMKQNKEDQERKSHASDGLTK